MKLLAKVALATVGLIVLTDVAIVVIALNV